MLGKYNMNVNKRVKELRRKNGFTQEEIAEILGMKTSTYSQMERSGKIPIHIILQLSKTFKVDVTDILLTEEENSKTEETPQDELLIIDDSNSSKIEMKNPPIQLEDIYDGLALSNREENAIIMLRNLAPADREEVYKSIKIFHDKKFKKK